MSYERERKVTHVEKDVLVWLPRGANIPYALEEPTPAQLAEVGLCSLEELTRVRAERDDARARDTNLSVLKDALETAREMRDSAIARADKAEAELAQIRKALR